MVLPFRLRAALFALVMPLHGMGLCVAPGNQASTDHARPETGAGL